MKLCWAEGCTNTSCCSYFSILDCDMLSGR